MLFKIVLVIVSLIFLIFFLKDYIDMKKLPPEKQWSIIYSMDEAAVEILKLGLKWAGILFLIGLGYELIAAIIKFFVPALTALLVNIDHFIVNVMIGCLIGSALGLYFLLIIVLVIDGVTIPFRNYVLSVQEIYGDYPTGKYYYCFCNFAEKCIMTLLLAGCIAILLPEGREKMFAGFFSDTCDKGCFEEIYLTGSIVEGNEAYLSDSSVFYPGIWRLRSDSDDKYEIIKNEYTSHTVGFSNVTTNFANVNGMLLGVSGDYKVVQRSMNGFFSREIDYAWKKSIQTDGEYDYQKIYDIIKESKNKEIPVEKAATIVGALQERVLLGVDDEEKAVFWKHSMDGEYFVYMTSEGTTEWGPYIADTTIPMKAAGNIVMYITIEGKLTTVNLNTGKANELNLEPMAEQSIKDFNYYIKDDAIRVACVTDNKVHIFSFKEDPEYQSLNLTGKQATIEGIYISDKMLLIDRVENKFSIQIFDE